MALSKHLGRGAPAALVGTVLFAFAPARADYLGIVWEEDAFGLNGVTPLAFIEGYAGQRVINVYAAFDDPVDQCVGVVGTTDHPFRICTFGASGFVNSEVPNSDSPLAGMEQVLADLNFDSFYGVGCLITGPTQQGAHPSCGSDELIVVPTTTPPDTDPWPLDPALGTNMAWTVPPLIDGTPTPQSVAGNFDMMDGSYVVFLMRLVIGPAEGVNGRFGAVVFENGVRAVKQGTITVPPLEGAGQTLYGLATQPARLYRIKPAHCPIVD
ncbi:MAG: hypothetical protein ACYTGC_15330, partial [Planctomycetota bacterium]